MTAPVLQLDQVVAGHTVEPEALREVATAIGTRVSELPVVELAGLSAAETQLFDLQRTLHTSASSHLTVHLGTSRSCCSRVGPQRRPASVRLPERWPGPAVRPRRPGRA